MKFLAICLLMFLPFYVSAQEIESDCNLLNRCISTPIFAKNFLYSKVTADTITLMDSSNVIPYCNLTNYKGKVFTIQKELIPKKQLVTDNSIILFLIAKRECVLVYFFFSPYNGGHLSFNFLRGKDGDYEIVGYMEGDF